MNKMHSGHILIDALEDCILRFRRMLYVVDSRPSLPDAGSLPSLRSVPKVIEAKRGCARFASKN